MAPHATLAASTAKSVRTSDGENAWTMTPGLRKASVAPATKWLLSNFGDTFREKLSGSHISLSLLCAVACQESGYTWFENGSFGRGRTPSQMMRLLVLDNVAPRGAFPSDTKAFLADRRYSDIAAGLIKVSDESRIARGYKATGNLLFGYGLFQYDLQNIESDPSFWREVPSNALPGSAPGLWGDVGACIDRFVRLMTTKLRKHNGDVKAALAAYNGSGANAHRYAEIVLEYQDVIASEIER